MAGLTQTAWVATTVNGHLVLKCTLTQVDTELYDSFTYKTPKELDPTNPWILYVNTAATDLHSTTLPVDLWVGYDDNAALAGGTGVTGTNAAEIASAIIDDVDSKKRASRIDPNYSGSRIQGTADTGGMINGSKPSYFIINLDGGSELTAGACAIVITQ